MNLAENLDVKPCALEEYRASIAVVFPHFAQVTLQASAVQLRRISSILIEQENGES
jgi:hypothetical protein